MPHLFAHLPADGPTNETVGKTITIAQAETKLRNYRVDSAAAVTTAA